MVFIESQSFTERIRGILADDELADFQSSLAKNPKLGDVIRGTGGLRKVRIPDTSRGKGKRGGARVFYLHLEDRNHVHLLFVFGKDEQDDLTPAQKKQLRAIVTRIKGT